MLTALAVGTCLALLPLFIGFHRDDSEAGFLGRLEKELAEATPERQLEIARNYGLSSVEGLNRWIRMAQRDTEDKES